ncbi:N-acetylneuraminate synthase [Roseivirga pacifica]
MKQNKVIIIAEAGVNHNGSTILAKKLIDAAAQAGVDLIKFQTFKAEKLVSKGAQKASYQKKNTNEKEEGQFEMLKRLELTEAQHEELIAYAKEKGLEFFSTAFDTDGLEYLNSLGFSRFKVPSGEITNYPYLKKIASFKKPVILSTGMADMKEIKEAVDLLTSKGLPKEDITILHCNTEYPTPMEDVNLHAMKTIEAEMGVKIGYSDHTLGIEVPIAAVALGAVVIEKHFTLDRSMPGPDHRASLEPGELKAMVAGIRNIEKAIAGNGRKEPSKSELKNRVVGRKSLFFAHNMKKGQTIGENDLMTLRPGDGVSPMKMKEIIGKTLLTDVMVNEKLNLSHIIHSLSSNN